MAGKGKRQVTYHTRKVIEGKSGSESPQPCKKDKNIRHSYHPGTSSFNIGYPLQVEGVHSNYNYIDRRSFVTRERSFVRPNTLQGKSAQGTNHDGGDLQRQRSFVHPGQLLQQQGQHQKRRSVMPAANQRGKPALEIYRPPTLRGPNIFENGANEFLYNVKDQHEKHEMSQGIYANSLQTAPNHRNYVQNSQNNGIMSSKPGLNIHAKEFVSSGGNSLQHSKSSGNLHNHARGSSLQHSKSGNVLRGSGGSGGSSHKGQASSPPRVHFSDDKENEPKSKDKSNLHLAVGPMSAMGNPVKRSKSLGSADMRKALSSGGEHSVLSDIGPFSQEVHNTISKAINDPNALTARQLMEVSRHLFTRVVESSKHAEPTARLCITIIENEKEETFLETLLNTCQEYFQMRDRLLRNTPPGPYHGYVPSHPRWIAYMTFLNEMYTQLKRRHVQLMTRRMRNSETAPGLLLLTLLAQCCQVCLREQAVNSLAETECLFFVLTAVGKDIEVELPQQMGRVMGAARDAFLTTVHVSAVRKTLLQLIEMHAARWQLPASAVMYYYPGSSAK